MHSSLDFPPQHPFNILYSQLSSRWTKLPSFALWLITPLLRRGIVPSQNFATHHSSMLEWIIGDPLNFKFDPMVNIFVFFFAVNSEIRYGCAQPLMCENSQHNLMAEIPPGRVMSANVPPALSFHDRGLRFINSLCPDNSAKAAHGNHKNPEIFEGISVWSPNGTRRYSKN